MKGKTRMYLKESFSIINMNGIIIKTVFTKEKMVNEALNYKPLWIQLAERLKENSCYSNGGTYHQYYGTNGKV